MNDRDPDAGRMSATVEAGDEASLRLRIAELETRLEEAEETLEAIRDIDAVRSRDVDAVMKQKKERRQAEESLRIALEASEMGSWDLDLVADIARSSVRHDEIFGIDHDRRDWGREVFLGCVYEADREAAAAAFTTAAENGALEFECRIRRSNDGALRWIRVLGKTYYDDGKPMRMAGVVADITKQRQFEDQLRQAVKMEAVGQLTGGLAHDFNNLLTVILGNLELVQGQVTDEALARKIGHAQHAAERGAGLTQQLLSFSRRQSLQPRVIRIDDLLPDLGVLLQRAVGGNIELRLVGGDGLWNCEVDPNQLESALLNLAINARDAMPDGGVLVVETANIFLSEQEAVAMGDVSPGRYVKIAVTDTGQGMSAETRARVFEPFFTTKEIGQGSGLGLSMVYGFARQSKGHVTINSEEGNGAAIHLYLPWAGDALPRPSQQAAQPQANPEPATVLVVEDDSNVRQLAVQLVGALGHRVFEAENGPDALVVLDRQPEIDLLFTDVVMPHGMSGIDLAHEALRRRPGLAVLLASGFTSQSLAQGDGSPMKDFRLIRKPYGRENLIEAIDAVRSEARQQQAAQEADAPQELGVLVVEDEPLIAMMLEDMLESMGYRIAKSAATLAAALDEAKTGQFDIALLDVNLGKETVYPVADLLTTRKIPFGFMTGHDSQSLPEQYRGSLCLSKPYTDKDLASALTVLAAGASPPRLR